MNKPKAALVYVDFDDTLYCHEVHWSYSEDFTYNMMYGFKKCTYDPKYLNHELINKLRQIIEFNKQNGLTTIVSLLTGCRTSVYYKAKVDLLEQNVPGLFDNYFSVVSQEEKLPMILAYNDELKKDYDIVDTLIIDDGYNVTCACQDAGFEAVTPGFFEKHYEANYTQCLWYK